MGVMWNIKSNQGYDRRSLSVPAAAAGVVALRELQPLTSYYLMPVMRTADGQLICGPQSGLMTTS